MFYYNVHFSLSGHMIALTTSGSVLLRKMEKTQTELFVIGNNCQKLIQGGHQCFGFFEDRGEIIVRCVQINKHRQNRKDIE